MATSLASSASARAPATTAVRARSARAAFVSAPLARPCAVRTPAKVFAAAAETEASAGPDKWNKTYYPTGADAAALDKEWFVIDAEGQTLGRLACLAAQIIRGKDQVTYTPSMDMGNFVVVINADKVVVTGRKFEDKLYRRHTNGRPGTLKTETFKDLQARLPERIIESAVKGMLPKGRLGSRLFHHMKVYRGPEHPHEPQNPVDVTHRINQKFN